MRHTLRSLSVLAVASALACSSSSNDDGHSARTVDERTSVGTLPGSLVVLPGGDASYSIPIEVPPGRAGLQPALSFEYNSGVGNDWLGVGWGIGGISAIQACGRNHRDNGYVAGPFEDDTNYCLDGAILHRVADAEVTNGDGLAEYRTRPDSFARITRGADGWTVESRGGEIHAYTGAGGAFVRTSTTDRSGNRIEYAFSDTNRPRLTGVAYDFIGQPYAKVDLVYSERPDELLAMYRGHARSITERLIRVDVSWDGDLVRSYRLSYHDQIGLVSTTGRGLLATIEVCNGAISGGELSASVCLPPTRFRYQEGEAGIDPGVDVDLPRPEYAHAVLPIDINGDGSDDVVFVTDIGEGLRWAYAYANRSVPSGFDPAVVTDLRPGEARWIQALDLNNDRRQDFAYLRDEETIEMVTAQPFGVLVSTIYPAQANETISFLTAIDVNGDGFRDLVTCEGSDEDSLYWVWYRATGTVLLERAPTDIPCRPGAKLVVDIDQNGATDVVELGQRFECNVDEVALTDPDASCQDACPIDATAQAAACLAAFDCELFGCQTDSNPPQCHAAPGDVTCPGTSGDLQEDCSSEPTGPETCSWGMSGDTGHWVHANQLAGPLARGFYARFQSPHKGLLEPLATVDLVGDGTVDVVFRKTVSEEVDGEPVESVSLVVFLSTGAPDGYIETEVAGSLLLDSDPRLIRFIDWESDGDTDLIVAHEGEWKLLSYHIDAFGIGDTVSSLTMSESVLEIGIPVTGQIMVGDYDGDGLADLLTNDGLGLPGDSTDRWTLYRHRETTFRQQPARGLPDLLREITNGFGETTFVDYRPLTDEAVGVETCTYPQRCDAAPRPVVARHWIEDHPPSSYSYFGPRADMHGRRDLGFERVVITTERGPGYDPAITWLEYDNSTFDQDRDAYLGAGAATRRTTWVGKGSNTSKHRVYQTVYDYQVIDTVDLQDGGSTYFVHAQHTYERSYELKNGIASPDDVASMAPLSTRHLSVARDGFGNLLSSADDLSDGYLSGTETTYQNDTSSWLIGRPRFHTVQSLAPDDAKSRTVELRWYPNGLLEWAIRAPSDAANRISTHYEYDDYGNLEDVFVTDRYGTQIHQQHIEYDAFARVYPTHVTNALGQTSAATWDFGFGVVTRSADPEGVGPSYELDEFGRPTRVEIEHFDGTTTGEGAVITYQRRDNGPPKSASRLRIRRAPYSGRLSWTDYDQHGRTELDGVYLADQASQREYDYDALDRLVAMSEPTWAGAAVNAWTHYEWDNHDRLTLVAAPDGATVQHQYAAFTVTSIDAEGRRARRVHDVAGRLIQSIDGYGTSDASRLCYQYGAFDQVSAITRGCGTPSDATTTSYEYSDYGLKVGSSDPAIGEWGYRYDGFDRLYESTDGNGARLRYDYDDLHRRTQRLEVDTGIVASWRWDTDYAGTLYETEVTSGPTVRYEHDKFGRPSVTATILDGESLAETYWYDGSGRLSMTTMPTQPGLAPFRLSHAYSNRSLLIGLVDADVGTVFWELEEIDPAGRTLLETLGNGLQTKREYDEVGRYLSLRTDNPGNLGALIAGPTGAFWETYSWDLSGNLHSRHDELGAQHEVFEYDALNRLGHVTTTSGGATVNAWATYDTFGNFVTRTGTGTYETTPGGRVLSTDDRSYTYDGNGNVLGVDPIGDFGTYTGGGKGDDLPASITWNAHNKPVTIETPEGLTELTYDADGRVVRRVEPDKTILRVGAYERITTPKGTEDRYRIYGPDGLVAQVTRTKELGLADPRTGGRGTSISKEAVVWVHSDHLGSARAMTDSSGAVVEELSYDAWGRPRPNSWLAGGPGSDQSLLDTDFGGHRNGGPFVDMGGRHFEPHSGVFLSPDPFIQAPDATQNLNRYIYVFQNPTSLIDPTGHFAEMSIARGWGGGYGGGFGAGAAVGAGALTSFVGDPGAWANGFRNLNRAFRSAGRAIRNFFKNLGDGDRGGGNEPQSSRSSAVSTEMGVTGGDGTLEANLAIIQYHVDNIVPQPSARERFGNALQGGLDLCGFAPVVGTYCDGFNAGIYGGKGDWSNAGISLASALLPFLKWGKAGAEAAESGLVKVYSNGGRKGSTAAAKAQRKPPKPVYRTPDGKFARAGAQGARAYRDGRLAAEELAAELRLHGVDVVGIEMSVMGPVGRRTYDIVTREGGQLWGIEVKFGSATRSMYQRFTDAWVDNFGAPGIGRLEGEVIQGTRTVHLPD